MGIKKDLYQYLTLSEIPAVSPNSLRQSPSYPCVELNVESSYLQSSSGPLDLQTGTVTLMVFALSVADADTIVNDLNDILNGYVGNLNEGDYSNGTQICNFRLRTATDSSEPFDDGSGRWIYERTCIYNVSFRNL